MITQHIASYMAFLLAQMEADATVLNNPWLFCTVVPFFLYAFYMGLKWYLLLAPLTVPLTTFMVLRADTSKAKWLWKN